VNGRGKRGKVEDHHRKTGVRAGKALCRGLKRLVIVGGKTAVRGVSYTGGGHNSWNGEDARDGARPQGFEIGVMEENPDAGIRGGLGESLLVTI